MSVCALIVRSVSKRDASATESARSQAAATLRALKAYRGTSSNDLAVGLDVSRPTVQGYLAGRQQLTVTLMVNLARLLHVDPRVFFLPPDDALRWTIDNAPNGQEAGFNSADTPTNWYLSTLEPPVASPAA